MKAVKSLLFLSIILTLVCHSAPVEAAKTVTFGIVRDGPGTRYAGAVEALLEEVGMVLSGEYDARFPEDKVLDGNWTSQGVEGALDILLADPQVDIVLALGFASSHLAASRTDLPKPVIAPFIIDVVIQDLPFADGASGVHNLAYIDSFRSLRRDLEVFDRIVPVREVALLASSYIFEAIPQLERMCGTYGKDMDIVMCFIPVTSSAEEALEALPKGVDAVLVAPLPRFDDVELDRLVAGLIERRLPSLSIWEREEVERGLMATLSPTDTMDYLARNMGIMVLNILGGRDAGTIPVAFSPGEELVINMATARAIGVYPSLMVMTDALLINEKPEPKGEVITLESAVSLAMSTNLELAAADRRVAAGEDLVLESRSPLLPQIDLSAAGTVIDDDRAEAALGVLPERRITGSAQLRQLIYADSAWAGYDIEKHLQTSRVEDRESLRLDVIQEVAVGYLKVLRAMTTEKIQKDNLKLTRSNLERARIRVSVGAAGPEEVYRWETVIAQSRSDVLAAESATRTAMITFNRILNRSQKDEFYVQALDPKETLYGIIDERTNDYLNDERSIGRLSDFMVLEGLAGSPELGAFDAFILAQDRALLSAGRTQYIPVFSLEAGVTETLDEGGAGSDPPPTATASADDTDWTVGVFATYPLYAGGQITAAKRRAMKELDQLQTERAAFADRIEERILAAVQLIRTSYPSIQLSSEAAEAAGKNQDLVIDAYAEGIKSIIDLIDAQNQSLTADLRAANTAYDFLVDLASLQRAIGSFAMYEGVETRTQFLSRLEEYFDNQE
jgi:outer membrane protein